ncbi:F0F1 ATP synthase subunit delta [Vibrio olivae]|uniref:ATP synthase subunit delta n=1 Tax=Vibrio olivae TaxID=1243002 RepID=A0ABV5HQ03_9VIBR
MSELTEVAQPYAKAAFDYAKDAGSLEDWQQMFAIIELVMQQPKTQLLMSELDEESSEQPLLDLILSASGEWLDKYFENFLKVMAENQRLIALSDVIDQFRQLKADYEQVMTVTVWASEPLDEAQKAQLIEALQRKHGKAVTLEQQLDPSLVGGVVIKAGETVYDGSIQANIERLATNLHV